ncbi:MAG: DUF6093 family protein [Pseudolysinimonas sp.]
MSRESVTARGRTFAEEGMTSTCRIGDYTPTVGDDLATAYTITAETYAGACELEVSSSTTGRAVDAGTQVVSLRDAVLEVPVIASGNVKAGQMVEMVTNPLDTSTVGLQLRIGAPDDKTYGVTRRFPVEVMP